MAIIKQGIMGGFSGTIGNIVGSSWKGIDVMKSKPLSVSNPKTAAQQAQRGKFGQTVAFGANLLSTIIKPLWDRFAMQMSGFNAFVKANIDYFDSDGISDYENLKISEGKMSPVTGFNCSAMTAGDTIDLSWTPEPRGGFELSTDLPYFVIINETSGWIVKIAVADKTRDSEELVGYDVPSVDAGDAIHAYCAFIRADGTIVSDTAYKLSNIV